MSKSCHMYENKYPVIGETVMVKIKSITDMGIYVSLLEYNNIEGLMLTSEISTRRIRSMHKLIKIGNIEPVIVSKVDEGKGYIDLSKKRITADDREKCEKKYSKTKTVHSILCQVADKCNINIESLYQMFGWDLYKKFDHCYDAFVLLSNGSQNIDNVFGSYNIPKEMFEILQNVCKLRLTPPEIRISAEIELTCFTEEGIDGIKEALRAGHTVVNLDSQVIIKLIASPKYILQTVCIDKDKGLLLLQNVLTSIKDTITERGGHINITNEPHIVNEEYLDKRLYKNKEDDIKEEDNESSDEEDEKEEDEEDEEEDVKEDEEDKDNKK